METKTEAEKSRDEVLKELGSGWTGYVWENLGRHVNWHKGAVILHYEHCTQEFWAMVGEVNSGAGHMDLTPRLSHYSKNPKEAIQAACVEAQQVFKREWEPIMDSVRGILKELQVTTCDFCGVAAEQFYQVLDDKTCPECTSKAEKVER